MSQEKGEDKSGEAAGMDKVDDRELFTIALVRKLCGISFCDENRLACPQGYGKQYSVSHLVFFNVPPIIVISGNFRMSRMEWMVGTAKFNKWQMPHWPHSSTLSQMH